ncbi:helix-turn-helix domain-containing protein [Bacillus sp. FJAT-47783]|uniref:helix-turn-helix domain-containing protein n=1 Tax=Bacillus sp. FJAT-47783 TaxID=2922712 RepID=UPI001FAD5E0E|nr:helix-turn-helix domain-containing protein [Bacillus sp. FJAT-47783]
MVKLLIAERDNQERNALQWLISAYSIPIQTVILAGTVQEAMRLLEKEAPDLFYLELDMVRKEDWHALKHYVNLYTKKVICVTAETTFARAKQAIECQSIDLLVKPLEPMKIKQCMTSALSSISSDQSSRFFPEKIETSYSYRSLFVKQQQMPIDVSVMLLKTESKMNVHHLRTFLENEASSTIPFVFPLTDLVVCLIPHEEKNLKQVGTRILQEWEEKNTEPLAIVIIPFHEQYNSLYEMYQSARKLLEVTFFIGYRQIILPEAQFENWKALDPFLTPNEQRIWIEMLNEFDKEKIKQWMYDEFLHLKAPYPQPGLLRTKLTSILAQVRRFMKTYNLHEREIEKYYLQIFDDILYSPVLYRIVQEMLLFIYDLLDKAKREQEQSRTNIIEKGIAYIEQHFTNPDLTLEMVASIVERSPAYYSHLLMKKHGSSFRQIVTALRINEAKKLLQETNLTVQEIAERVGFRNANYFSKTFKEVTRSSPRDFRTEKKR